MKSIARKLTSLQLVCAVIVVALLFTLMNRELSRRMTESFMTHGEVVAAALAKSVEPALVSHDLTSVQSALDASLTIPNVEWAYVAALDGRVLADTFAPKFPDALKEQSQSIKTGCLIRVVQDEQQAVVFEKPVLTGIVGRVYIGFNRACPHLFHSLDGADHPHEHCRGHARYHRAVHGGNQTYSRSRES
ncbi:MAG: hypothetical protein ACRD3Q_20675, partial [Terriglobales bacterium]